MSMLAAPVGTAVIPPANPDWGMAIYRWGHTQTAGPWCPV